MSSVGGPGLSPGSVLREVHLCPRAGEMHELWFVHPRIDSTHQLPHRAVGKSKEEQAWGETLQSVPSTKWFQTMI